jgi:DNA (cytosine-5)-methyltransferase 1
MDKLTKEQRLANMRANKSKGTIPELVFARLLYSAGIRYRKNDPAVKGKPDFTIRGIKLAIFCDGDYWHGKDWPLHKGDHKSNQDFWIDKIESNIKHDTEVNKILEEQGWTVLRFWDTDILKHPKECLNSVLRAKSELTQKQHPNISSISNKIRGTNMGIQIFGPHCLDDGGNVMSFNDQMAIISHYIHNRNYKSGEPYRDKALELIADVYQNKTPNSEGSIVEDGSINLDLFRDMYDVPFPPIENPVFTFIDLFAGIGGFRMAMQSQGGLCVFSSEWNEYAQKTYYCNYGEVPFGDITKEYTKSFIPPDFDVLCAGFPCQPFSIAGISKKKSLGRETGFLDKTQGTLFFDVADIIQRYRPKAFFLENVKNLVSHDKGNTFNVIKTTLESLEYSVHYKVIDGKSYVPQHRERIMIVGFDKRRFINDNFQFPETSNVLMKLKDILQSEVPDKYILSDKLWLYLQNYAIKQKERGNGFGFGLADLDGVSRTLSARYYKDGSEILIPRGEGMNPRKLTPRECARLMGYPDNFIIDKVSDVQAYRQLGNSVVVPQIKAVSKKLIEEIHNHE